MVRLTFLLAVSFLTFGTVQSYAQTAQDLKGPKAKNYKPWKEQARKGTLSVKLDEADKKGPAYKNHKVWEGDASKVEVASELVTKKPITGPKAKNQKPWKKD